MTGRLIMATGLAVLAFAGTAVAEGDPLDGVDDPVYEFVNTRTHCAKTMCFYRKVVDVTNVEALPGRHPRPEVRPSVYATVGSDAYITKARVTQRNPVRILASGRFYGVRGAWTIIVRNTSWWTQRIVVNGSCPKH